MAANWTAFVAGDVLTAAQLNGVVDNFADIAIFNETQASGTNGGTPIGSTWTKRTLNTTQVNNIASCTLTSSVVSLPAGTYLFYAKCPSYNQGARGRIQNTTAGTTLVLGLNQFVGLGTNSTAPNDVQGVATLSATSNIELQYYTTLTSANVGLGNAQSYGVSEVYGQLMIVRIA
jgi:hypothetical protein